MLTPLQTETRVVTRVSVDQSASVMIHCARIVQRTVLSKKGEGEVVFACPAKKERKNR